jgi:hypothetical protein
VGHPSSLATRSYKDIAVFFTGFELVKPGLVPTSQWRPQEPMPITDSTDMYAGVGRKP